MVLFKRGWRGVGFFLFFFLFFFLVIANYLVSNINWCEQSQVINVNDKEEFRITPLSDASSWMMATVLIYLLDSKENNCH